MSQIELFAREKTQLGPGCFHIPDWLPMEQQQELVENLRQWCAGGFWVPTMPDGTPMNHPLCGLGWDWKPYEYIPTARPFPVYLHFLAMRAIADTLPDWKGRFWPDVAIINHFPVGSSLGLHQDRSEDEPLKAAGSPIVTLSLGDSAIFRLGQRAHRDGPYTDVEVRSGDLLVMGGYSRMSFHGITKILPNTAPPDLGTKPGRLSVTIRQAKEVKA